jgi:hypothetical protein
MPKLATLCTGCNKKITTKDYESGMVVKSSATGSRWCPRCTLKSIRKGVR